MLNRWRHFLSKGFHLLGRHHQLLAFSSNQLRTACAWFMSPIYEHELSTEQRAKWNLPPLEPLLIEEQEQEEEQGVGVGEGGVGEGDAGQGQVVSGGGYGTPGSTDGSDQQSEPPQVPVEPQVWRDAEAVIYWLGTFEDCKKNPAKYAARIGQAFSSTVRAQQYIPTLHDDVPVATTAQDHTAAAAPRQPGQRSHLHRSPSSSSESSSSVHSISGSVSAAAHDLSPATSSESRDDLSRATSSESRDDLDTLHIDCTSQASSENSCDTSAALAEVGLGSGGATGAQVQQDVRGGGGGSAGGGGRMYSGGGGGGAMWVGEWGVEEQAPEAAASGIGPKTYFRAYQVPQYERTRWDDYSIQHITQPHGKQGDDDDPPRPDPDLVPDHVVIDHQHPEGKHKYIISDGGSPMGMEVAAEVMTQIGLTGLRHPLTIQVRCGGFKGVLVPWGPDIVPPAAIKWRKSMKKFDSPHTDIEVVQVATFIPGYINRQIITLLLALGLDADRKGQIIKDKAEQMTSLLDGMLSSSGSAASMLRSLGYVDARTSRLLTLALSSGMSTHEPFIHRMLNHMRMHALTMLRLKHRIYLEASAFLMGVLDEAGVLTEHEIFVQVHRPGDEEPFIVKNKWLMVTKNPCLHPGDIRVLRAVDRPELRHLVNVVVFPRRVSRPVTDMIAGSDLDGDQYFCCWDQTLIPLDDDDQPVQADPGEYEALPAVEIDGVKVDPHLIDQFLYFQVHDTLGMIANAHVAMADQHPAGAKCGVCMKLAEKHAHAVDLAKTCRPVTLSQSLRPKNFPHFMENLNKASYKSHTVLGKVYDWACALPLATASPPGGDGRAAAAGSGGGGGGGGGDGGVGGGGLGATQPEPRLVLDQEPSFQVELSRALELCYAYNCEVLRLMAKYGCRSEVELMSGWLIKRAGEHVRKKEGLRQQILLEVGALKGRYQQFFRALPVPGASHPLTASRDVLRPESYLQTTAQDMLLLGSCHGGQPSVLAGARAAYRGHRKQQQQQQLDAESCSQDETPEESHYLLIRASAWYYAAYCPAFHPKGTQLETSGPRGGGGGGGDEVAQWRGMCLLSFGWLHMERLLHGVNQLEERRQ